MSWLSKALGLDKKPKLLKVINEVAEDILVQAAERAISHNLKDLTEAQDATAVVHQVLQRLTTIPGSAKPKEQMAQLISDLREAAGLK